MNNAKRILFAAATSVATIVSSAAAQAATSKITATSSALPATTTIDTMYVTPEAADTITAMLGVQLLTGLESYVMCHEESALGENKIMTKADFVNVRARSNTAIAPAVPDNPCGSREGNDSHPHIWSMNERASTKPSMSDIALWLLGNLRNRRAATHCIFTLDAGNCYEGITINGVPVQFDTYRGSDLRTFVNEANAGTITLQDISFEKIYTVVLQPDPRASVPSRPSLARDIYNRASSINPSILNRPYNRGRQFPSTFIASRAGYRAQ